MYPESELPYYSQRYFDGTECDLTGVRRSTEVRYTCGNAQVASTIVDVKEPSSCTYLITVTTPLLCKHPVFKPKRETVLTIPCFPVDGESAPTIVKQLNKVNFSYSLIV